MRTRRVVHAGGPVAASLPRSLHSRSEDTLMSPDRCSHIRSCQALDLIVTASECRRGWQKRNSGSRPTRSPAAREVRKDGVELNIGAMTVESIDRLARVTLSLWADAASRAVSRVPQCRRQTTAESARYPRCPAQEVKPGGPAMGSMTSTRSRCLTALV